MDDNFFYFGMKLFWYEVILVEVISMVLTIFKQIGRHAFHVWQCKMAVLRPVAIIDLILTPFMLK